MPIRSGDEYLAGIRDGREVWLDGERVDDVTTHPRLKGFAQTLAAIYDLQRDPEVGPSLTMTSPTTGDRVGLGYILPRSVDDLVRRRQMIEFLMRRSGGTIGRLPEYMASILVGLYDVRHILAEADPAYAGNVEAYLEMCRENDVSLTHGFADAPHDQRLPRDRFENLRVVDKRPDGVVVRGVKSVATLAPYADEYLALAPNRPGLAPEEIVYFAVPLNTPGVRVYCRPSLSQPPSPGHPLSSAYDEMDSWVVFEDVLVPANRVFYLQRTEVHLDLLNQILSWAFYHILVRMACKAEVLAGICAAVSDYLGKEDQQLTQLALCDVYVYVETLRAFIHAAEREPHTSASGLLFPNPTQITLGRIYAVDHHPEILQTLRELCGSGILMAPGQAEIDTPTIGADVNRYLVGADTRALERFQLLKLAWEYSCESFGSRQLLFEMHNAGAQITTKQRLARTYEAAPLKQLAKQLAGIRVDSGADESLSSRIGGSSNGDADRDPARPHRTSTMP
jgi:4-hydroxyphenylacetate 3-monooxygenase